MSDPAPLAVAVAVARQAGALARAAYQQPLKITSKGGTDIVTQVDHAAEALICEQLAAAFPDDAILAEERGAQTGHSGHRWIIDPLDGTHNFAAQLPFWCLSIARVDKAGQPMVGVVYDALHDELFTAVRGAGATLNGQPVRVSAVAQPGQAVVACDIGYNAAVADQMMRSAQAIQPRVRRVRVLGSAVLAMAYVAAGRLDCFFHQQVQPWDVAAAWLLIAEAGGRVTAWDGGPMTLTGQTVVAANPTLQPQMVRLLAAGAGR